MTDPEQLAHRADVADKLALVAIEMVLTLGTQLGKGFDLGAYAETLDDPTLDPADAPARREVADRLRRIAAALAG
jgi:hypothetical protein